MSYSILDVLYNRLIAMFDEFADVLSTFSYSFKITNGANDFMLCDNDYLCIYFDFTNLPIPLNEIGLNQGRWVKIQHINNITLSEMESLTNAMSDIKTDLMELTKGVKNEVFCQHCRNVRVQGCFYVL